MGFVHYNYDLADKHKYKIELITYFIDPTRLQSTIFHTYYSTRGTIVVCDLLVVNTRKGVEAGSPPSSFLAWLVAFLPTQNRRV